MAENDFRRSHYLSYKAWQNTLFEVSILWEDCQLLLYVCEVLAQIAAVGLTWLVEEQADVLFRVEDLLEEIEKPQIRFLSVSLVK